MKASKSTVLDTFIEAAESAGIPRSDDFNAESNEGCGYFDVNQKTGRRWSSARGFLDPALKRANLTVLTGTLVDRVRREVVLSSGTIASPARRQSAPVD